MFCTKCGRTLNEGEVCSCQVNNNPMVNNDGDSINVDFTAIKDNASKVYKLLGFGSEQANAFEKGKQIVPDCICSNEGEIPIKQYDFARLRSLFSLSFAEGKLQITNKRVIIRAAGIAPTGKTTYHQEFKIDEIAGFEIRKGQRFSFAHLLIFLIVGAFCAGIGYAVASALYSVRAIVAILSLVLGVASIAGYFIFDLYLNKNKSHKKFYILKHSILSIVVGFLAAASTISIGAFVLVPVGILYLFNSLFLIFAPSLTAIIKTNGGSSALELKRKEIQLLQFKSEENSGFMQVMPWKDTDMVIKEIGTIVDDLQTMGDVAIDKWKKQ